MAGWQTGSTVAAYYIWCFVFVDSSDWWTTDGICWGSWLVGVGCRIRHGWSVLPLHCLWGPRGICDGFRRWWFDYSSGSLWGCGWSVRWHLLCSKQSVCERSAAGGIAGFGLPKIWKTIVFSYNSDFKGYGSETSQPSKKSQRTVCFANTTYPALPNNCVWWDWVVLCDPQFWICQMWRYLVGRLFMT